jgi:hypothetical protein
MSTVLAPATQTMLAGTAFNPTVTKITSLQYSLGGMYRVRRIPMEAIGTQVMCLSDADGWLSGLCAECDAVKPECITCSHQRVPCEHASDFELWAAHQEDDFSLHCIDRGNMIWQHLVCRGASSECADENCITHDTRYRNECYVQVDDAGRYTLPKHMVTFSRIASLYMRYIHDAKAGYEIVMDVIDAGVMGKVAFSESPDRNLIGHKMTVQPLPQKVE